MKENYEQFVGKTFNNLKVLKVIDAPEHLKDKRKYFRCECLLCGKIKDINSKNVRSGKTKTCGCGHFGMKQSKKLNKYIKNEKYIIGICSSGLKFYIDYEDYEKVKKYTWYEHDGKYIRTCLNVKNGKNTYCFLHNFILGKPEHGYIIDHIDGNPYNNIRKNLRIIDKFNNAKNLKRYSNNKTGIKGVSYEKRTNKYKAYITCEKNRINLGSYNKIEDATKIRKEAENKYFGEFNRKEK